MHLLAVSVALAVTACSTPHATNESVLGPCSQLSAICDSCNQPGPREQCEQAVSTMDDGQCEAVLDNAGVRAACIPPDASADALTDAHPPVSCGEAGVPDAGCACEADGGAPCAPTCPQGRCIFVCEPGATCAASCAGGRCVFECKAGSQCKNSCTGGGCNFACDVGSVCMDSCDPMPTSCTGP
ncbi:MAG TPA: hypothetical protein VF765_36810 [Polyangiaceae bacterium]